MKLLRNKSIISILATILILVIAIFTVIAMVQVAKTEPNNTKCYWSTNGLFCIGELGDK